MKTLEFGKEREKRICPLMYVVKVLFGTSQSRLIFFLLLLLFIGGFFLRLSFICLVVCFFSPSFPETVSYDLVMLVS